MSERRRVPGFWESAMTSWELKELCDYNGDRRRLVFTPEHVARMAVLQARFNAARDARHQQGRP